MKTKFILLAFITVFAFACKKDNVAPTLNIATPTEGAQTTGVVVIKGTCADEHLKTVLIKITRDATGSVIYTKELSIDGLTTYAFEEQYNPGITVTASAVTLTVEVADDNGSKTTKTVKFTLAP